MTQAQLERAVNALYEDDSLRSDMTDDEAQILLSWGEAQLGEMTARDLPDSPFDEWRGSLRALLGAVNRFIASRDMLMSGDEARITRELHGLAQAAGYEVSPSELEAFFQRQPTLDHAAAISDLLGLFRVADGDT